MARYYYEKEISHSGLNKRRIVKAETAYELNCKVASITAQWNAQWEREQQKQQKHATEQALRTQAERTTAETERTHARIDQFLLNALPIKPLTFAAIRSTFKPSKPLPVLRLLPLPAKPQSSEERFNPQPSLFTRLFKSKQHQEYCERLYRSAMRDWESRAAQINAQNDSLREQYRTQVAELNAERETYIAEIDALENEFQSGSPSAMERFVALLLGAITYPFPFEAELQTNYDSANRILIVDAFFPAIEDLPTLRQVTYVKTRNAISEKHFSLSDMRKKYNAFTYQVALVYFGQLYASIPESMVESIVLNGRVHTIDKANGQPITPCILSVRTTRSDFAAINLQQVDPVAWFRHVKGISAASFADATPVAPILPIQTDDKRFVDGYSVMPQLSASMNLAAMDWLDFENLIRELFEKEFSQNGGEVHITQASRDGGVDAVAFDPDPIRGGKIVIQAKRYTNVVGISAVRDLYGTVMNEGAMKGILVTTATYGKDAYDFIVGKPLTLINGSELLYLLEKHGHSACIDIAEARIRNASSDT